MMNQEKMAQDPPKCLLVGNDTYVMKLSRKNSFLFAINHNFGYEMRGSQILGSLLSVKSLNWSKKFVKSPVFAYFHNLVFTNAKFWHFLDWQKFLT